MFFVGGEFKAPFTVSKLNNAHLILAVEIGMWSISRMSSLVRLLISSMSILFILSVNIETLAIEIAQPSPRNFTSFILLSSIINWIEISSPHKGLFLEYSWVERYTKGFGIKIRIERHRDVMEENRLECGGLKIGY